MQCDVLGHAIGQAARYGRHVCAVAVAVLSDVGAEGVKARLDSERLLDIDLLTAGSVGRLPLVALSGIRRLRCRGWVGVGRKFSV